MFTDITVELFVKIVIEIFVKMFTKTFSEAEMFMIRKSSVCLYCGDGPSVIAGIFIEGPSPYISP